MQKIKIAIIGSGSSGLGAIRGLAHLEDLNIQSTISVLTPPELSHSMNILELSRLGRNLKPENGKLDAYDFGNFLSFRLDKGVVAFPSKIFEGFSSVWGASIGISESTNFFGDFVMDSEIIFENVPLRYFSLNERNKVAVKLSLCTFCGKCLSGCPTGAIWNSKEDFLKEVQLRKAEITRNYVDHLRINEENIEVIFSNGEVSAFDYVFLCAGAISSLSILLKSDLLGKSVKLKETKMVYVLGINLPKKFPSKSFALSTRRFELTNRANKRFGYLQIYDDGRGIWHRFKFVRKLFRRQVLFDQFISFFTISLLYLDSDDSAALQLKYLKGQPITISKIPLNMEYVTVLRHFLKLCKSFMKLGFLPILWRRAQVGESFHLGSVFGSPVSDELRSKKHIDSRVFVCDATTLDYLPLGPITPGIYLNSYNIAKKFVDSL